MTSKIGILSRWGAALLPVLCQGAWAQEASTQRIPTVTRLVKIFSQLESDLSDAASQHDAARAGNLLADDFEMRTAGHPGRPVPRADWLAALGHEKASASTLEQMAARDVGSVVLVSYLGRRSEGGNLFIMDAWRQEGGAWKLVIRYAASAGDGRVSIPGDAAETGVLPKKAE